MFVVSTWSIGENHTLDMYIDFTLTYHQVKSVSEFHFMVSRT